MTARIGPGRANPEEVVPLWKYWSQFGLDLPGVTIHGWWEDTPAIRTSDEQVKATCFLKPPSPSHAKQPILVALGNFGNVTQKVTLTGTSEIVGGLLGPMVARRIDGFQPFARFGPADSILVEAKHGWLLEIDVTPVVGTRS
jgi:hypothetical protein